MVYFKGTVATPSAPAAGTQYRVVVQELEVLDADADVWDAPNSFARTRIVYADVLPLSAFVPGH
jgi:hypothetical protein